MSFEQKQNYYPTVGQIERDISQKINTLYHNEFAYRISKVECHLFNDKIIVFCEKVITPIEKVLLQESSSHLINQVRTSLDSSLKVKIEELIENIVQVKVNKCIFNTDIDTNIAVVIALLANPPQVRQKRTLHRNRAKNVVQFNHSKNKLSEST